MQGSDGRFHDQDGQPANRQYQEVADLLADFAQALV
jgi:hypothetical protein